jgi:hypothetical protein
MGGRPRWLDVNLRLVHAALESGRYEHERTEHNPVQILSTHEWTRLDGRIVRRFILEKHSAYSFSQRASIVSTARRRGVVHPTPAFWSAGATRLVGVRSPALEEPPDAFGRLSPKSLASRNPDRAFGHRASQGRRSGRRDGRGHGEDGRCGDCPVRNIQIGHSKARG